MIEIKYDAKECPLYIGNTCTELDKAYQQGRADAFRQILEQMNAYRDAHYYSFANYDVQKYADGFKNATDTLISMVEHIKERKNEQ